MVETLTRPETPGRPTPTGTRPWLRPFWRITSALGAVVLIVTGTIQVAGLLGHEEETIVTTVPAEGLTTLVVDNQAGPVRVVGVSETDEVRVTARVSRGWRRTGHGQRVDGDRLVLDATCPVFPSEFCRVRYTVEVPRDMDVQVDADGWLRASDLTGDVEMTTDEGSIRLMFADVPDRVVADSDAGSVEVAVPDDGEPYDVTADSDAGSMTVDVRQAPDATRSIVATADAG